MTEHSHEIRHTERHETRTRRAFYIWMAAYAAVLVAIALAHVSGGIGGSPIDPHDIRTQQARASGEPQSSLASPLAIQPAALDVEG